uniref:Ketose-bisphosphate aldolase n=1 Tax=candidate division CPR3 bacterium TaxID=2268181 RepID=A0A7C4R2B9_UNCC3
MNLKEAFKKAERKGVAIGHFNVSNLETFESVVKAGKKTKKPVIIGVSEGAIKHAGIDFFIWAKEHFKQKYKADFFLHLDHGRNMDLIKKAIDSGFDSVMIDASHEKFNRNIYLTKIITKWAHKKGVLVEAELGTIGGAEENIRSRKIIFTDPLQAVEFIRKTRCDSLAVAIGTSHGPNKFLKKSHLNFEVLKKVKMIAGVPLVLHGASNIDHKLIHSLIKQGMKIDDFVGVDGGDIKKAIKFGIRKINTDTDLNLVAINEILKNIKSKNPNLKLYKILEKSMEEVEREVIEKIKLFSKK